MTTPQASQQVPEEVIQKAYYEYMPQTHIHSLEGNIFKAGFLAGMKWRDEKHNRLCAYWSNMKVDECDCREYA